MTGPGLISSCGAMGQVLPQTPATLLAWHRKLAAGTCDTAPHHRNPCRRPANHRKPMLGGLASEHCPGRVTPAKVQVNNRSSAWPGQDRGYFLATEGWTTAGPGSQHPARPELPRAEGPDRVPAWDWPGSGGGGRLDPGIGSGPGGPPAQSAATGQYAGPRPVKALG